MKKFIFTLLCMLMCVPTFAGAAIGDNTGTPTTGSGSNTIKWKIDNPLKIGSDISSIVTAVMKNIVMPLASVLVVLAILYAGFKFVIAQGNAKELEEARKGLVWVLVGSAILLGAYGISEVLQKTVEQVVPSVKQ